MAGAIDSVETREGMEVECFIKQESTNSGC